MNLKDTQPRDDWDTCPPGLIQETALRGGSNRSQVLWGALGLVVVLTSGLMSWNWMTAPPAVPAVVIHQQMRCQDVKGHLYCLVKDQIDDPELKSSVVLHVSRCECCCKAYFKLVKKLRTRNRLPLKPCHCETNMEP